MTEAVSDSRESEALNRVLDDPGTHIHSVVTSPGHTLAERDRLVAYDLDDPEQQAAARDAQGIKLSQPDGGSGNVLAMDRKLRADGARHEFNGSDSLVVLGRNAKLIDEVRVMHESTVVIAGQSGGRTLRLKANLRDRKERLFWGSGSSAEGTATSVKGDDVAWIVGDDCMFSWDIWVRPSDMHMIIDPAQRRVINPPRDVIVGPHVWVGQNSLIMKGAEIGAGSIIGANGLVPAGKLDPMIHVGRPVTKLREGVTWDREHDPSEAAFDRAAKVARLYGGSEAKTQAKIQGNAKKTSTLKSRVARRAKHMRPS